MNIRKALTAVAMTAVFLCSNIAVNADYSDEYADKDYRHQSVYNLYGEAVKANSKVPYYPYARRRDKGYA